MEWGRGYGAASGSPNGFSCSSEHLYAGCSSWLQSLPMASPSSCETTCMWEPVPKPLLCSLRSHFVPCDCANGRSVSTALKLCALDPFHLRIFRYSFLLKILFGLLSSRLNHNSWLAVVSLQSNAKWLNGSKEREWLSVLFACRKLKFGSFPVRGEKLVLWFIWNGLVVLVQFLLQKCPSRKSHH